MVCNNIIKFSMLFVCIQFLVQGVAQADSSKKDTQNDQHLIVMAAPSVTNSYYKDFFQQLIDFDTGMVKAVSGNDKIIILVDNKTRSFFKGKVADEVLLESDVADIWLRDIGTVFPKNPVKFVYRPDYLEKFISKEIDTSFRKFEKRKELKFKQSGIVLDGGNFVDNGMNRAVLTERIFSDNPNLQKKELVNAIKSEIGLAEIAIVPVEEGDTTGHSDGMVMWVSESKLLVNQYDEPFRTEVLEPLKNAFPGVEIVEIPSYPSSVMYDGFPSAAGLYVNAAVTGNYIYMPVFGEKEDSEMKNLIQSTTDKTVIPVFAAEVADLGGSVRCLTFQLKGKLAEQLITLAKTH